MLRPHWQQKFDIREDDEECLQAKKKLGFINGTLKKSDASTPKASHLMVYNSMATHSTQDKSDPEFDPNGPEQYQQHLALLNDKKGSTEQISCENFTHNDNVD